MTRTGILRQVLELKCKIMRPAGLFGTRCFNQVVEDVNKRDEAADKFVVTTLWDIRRD
jgi:hypothetical protein